MFRALRTVIDANIIFCIMKDKVVDALREMGFKIRKFKEDAYIFSYQGVRLVYKKYADDDSFLQIGMPLDKRNDKMDVHAVVNEMNIRLKYVKACVYGDNMWVIYERELKPSDDLTMLIKDIVHCMVKSMQFYLDLLNCRIDDAGEAS